MTELLLRKISMAASDSTIHCHSCFLHIPRYLSCIIQYFCVSQKCLFYFIQPPIPRYSSKPTPCLFVSSLFLQISPHLFYTRVQTALRIVNLLYLLTFPIMVCFVFSDNSHPSYYGHSVLIIDIK